MRIPVWNRELADLVSDGSIRQIGIVLEQHPDRARLFAQWQQIAWPIYVDAMNVLDLEVVPRSYLLDAQGIVVAVNPDEAAVRNFVGSPAAAGTLAEPRPPREPRSTHFAEGMFMDGEHTKALLALEKRAAGAQDQGRTRFRLGVARMAAAELPGAEAGLFAAALADWRAALVENPSQYIWRRRIQQYGPRLDKPYSFYDWVETARAELRARGEKPAPLRVEPAGAELAVPRPAGEADAPASREEPDPDRRMPLLAPGAVRLEHAVVAGTQDQPVVRVHLRMTPDPAVLTWHDEGEAAEAWLRAPDGWELVDGPRVRIVPPPVAEEGGSAPRRLEFELRRVGAGGGESSGYVLFDACFAADGVCARMRLDFRVPLP